MPEECKETWWRERTFQTQLSAVPVAIRMWGGGGRRLSCRSLSLRAALFSQSASVQNRPGCLSCSLSKLPERSSFSFSKDGPAERCESSDGISSLILLNALGGQVALRGRVSGHRCCLGTPELDSGQCWVWGSVSILTPGSLWDPVSPGAPLSP